MTEHPDLHQPVMTIAHQDMVTLHEDFTVQQALNDIRLQGVGEKIVYFYVVNTAGRLKGVILTRRLLTTPLEQRISEIMIKRLITVPHTATIMDAYDQLAHHKLLALPVVDPQQHILGVVDASTFMDDTYIKDITQRRKERLEIQRLHTRLRSILDHMRDLVLSFSYLDDFDRDRIDDFPFFDDHLVEINSSALSFYDVPASYILHKKMSVFDFIHDLYRKRIFELSQDMIYILRPDGQILDINPSGIRLMGLSSIEDAQQRSIIDFTVDPVAGKALVKEIQFEVTDTGYFLDATTTAVEDVKQRLKEIRDQYWRLKKVSDGHGGVIYQRATRKS